MIKSVLTLYTENTICDCIERGGICWWNISSRKADSIKYVIITQKGGFRDRQATAIVKVDSWSKHPSMTEQRISLHFSEYAILNIPDFWPKFRNPIHYVSDNILGYDLKTIKFTKVVKSDFGLSRTELSPKMESLSMDQIKELIAIKYNTSSDKVNITITG